MIPTGTPTRLSQHEHRAEPEAQTAELLLRAADGGSVEGRLSAPLTCDRSEILQVQQIHLEERTLSRGDTIAKWTGYAGAAVVAGLVGAGLANGSQERPGYMMLGVYALPLATVGVVESVRGWDRKQPGPATTQTVDMGRAPCAEPAEGWPMEVRNGDATELVHVGTQFRPLTRADDSAVLPAGYGPFAGTASVQTPVNTEGTHLTADVDGSLAEQIAILAAAFEQREAERLAAEAEARAAEKAYAASQVDTSPIVPAAYEAPAPAPAPEVEPESEREIAPTRAVDCPETRMIGETRYPVSFFEQALRLHTVLQDEWLSTISRDIFGDPMEYRQLFLLNQETLENPDRIFPGQRLNVPVDPRRSSDWVSDIPSACRNPQ